MKITTADIDFRTGLEMYAYVFGYKVRCTACSKIHVKYDCGVGTNIRNVVGRRIRSIKSCVIIEVKQYSRL